MKLVILTSFLFLSVVCLSQVGAYNDGSSRYDYRHNERFSLSASPLAIFDVYNGASYKGGITFNPLRRLRLTADIGAYWPTLTKVITTWEDMKGYNFRTSIGVDLSQDRSLIIGLGYQFKTQDFNYFDSVPNQPEFNALVNKKVHVFNVCASHVVPINDKFSLEARFALGVRYRETYNTQSATLENSVDWADSMTRGRITEGKSIIPNFQLMIRLNYTLWHLNYETK